MLIFDDLTIIICAVLLLLAMASVLTDTFLKCVPEGEDTAEVGNLEPVSVIIIADNNSCELEKHLPIFLSQDYPTGYEVIVVVSKNEDNTDDVLKSFMAQHKNLYATFVPDSSRYMSRRKLAITLGVKAAKHNLMLLTDADCCPDSNHWILSMATASRRAKSPIVVGYSNYNAGTKPFRLFCRLHRQYALMCGITAGRAFSTASRNLMFEKQMFMDGKGFQGNLKYLRGEYEFIVNKYGENNVVTLATTPNSRLTEDEPTRMAYINECVFHAETYRHLQRGLHHCAAFIADMFSLHLCLLTAVAAGSYAGFMQNWIVLGVAVLALIIPMVTRTLTARRAIRFLGVPISPSCAVIHELNLAWHNLAVSIRHKRADKIDFISHKS